jgi:hypothetical protein
VPQRFVMRKSAIIDATQTTRRAPRELLRDLIERATASGRALRRFRRDLAAKGADAEAQIRALEAPVRHLKGQGLRKACGR